jgi:iron complex transport system substrate-binding protein
MKLTPALIPALLAGSLALAACGSSDTTGTSGSPSASAASAGTVDNCGTTVKLGTDPQRIVTIKSTSTELALALGLGSKLVGTAFADGPVPTQWADQVANVPVLSDQAPSKEVVLAKEPDLVFGGWESNFSADTAGDRATLAKLGVATYVSPAACQEPAYQPKKMTFDLLFSQFEQAGQVLGAEKAATALVAEQRAALAKVAKAKAGTTALWWSSGDDTPYVGGGIGAPQMVLDAVGLTNVAADQKATWTSMGWEAIVASDPDVIVLVDATWNPATAKIKTLESNPATAALTAVKKHRFLVIPFPAAEAGVRSVSAAQTLSDDLGSMGLLAQ